MTMQRYIGKNVCCGIICKSEIVKIHEMSLIRLLVK